MPRIKEPAQRRSRSQPEPLSLEELQERLARADQQFRSLREELDHSQRLASLGTVSAGVAHEINNLLTPVLSYAQLALKNPNDYALHKKAFEKTIRGVESTTQIAHAMLGFARSSETSPDSNIAAAVKAALSCIGRNPARDRISIEIHVPKDLSVEIGPLSLQQVFMNLILNAWQAMEGRGGEIVICAKPQSGGMVSITVKDTGPGIPADRIETLFEPFNPKPSQSDGVSKAATKPTTNSAESATQSKGSGLGLNICRRLITQAGGTITVDSSHGKGATFAIDLPAATT